MNDITFPKVISTEKLENGDRRKHYENNTYIDETRNGNIKFYDSDGELKFIGTPDGTTYVISDDGKLYSKTAANGNLTLYNPDGTIKHELIAKKNKFSKFI
ncbi:hypothetical protein IJ182_09695 [bacterium]|nr:hypothetical protein [bacterium]